MAALKPLQLAGRVQIVNGRAEQQVPRSVVRLRSSQDCDKLTDHDCALVQSRLDLDQARKNGFGQFLSFKGRCGLSAGEIASDETHFLVSDEHEFLGAGDLLRVDFEAGRFRVIYRASSHQKFFFVTERCNHLCLMCSQPPRDVDDDWLLEEIASAVKLIREHPKRLGFTGGEPLTKPSQFIALLRSVSSQFPSTQLDVLTNGRAFANPSVAKEWGNITNGNLTACIPLYSSIGHVHDYVVQASGAFEETLLGLLRLADLGQSIQLRVVLHAISVRQLRELCRWIARNVPFVRHVALMGMENTGFALANENALWIDPIDYAEDLAWGVNWLSQAGLSVSIFNLPRCVLPERVRSFAVQSISDWKNSYIPECIACTEKNACAGFFSSGRPKFSRVIKAIR